jgi:hypothetical protein
MPIKPMKVPPSTILDMISFNLKLEPSQRISLSTKAKDDWSIIYQLLSSTRKVR